MIAWALEMIEAIDEQYQVTAEGKFGECGSSFVPSIRRAVLQGADLTHRDIRGQSFTLTKGPLPLCKEVEFKLKIIKSVAEHPPRSSGLTSLSDEITYRRKPLTYAHGGLASLLGQFPGHLKVHHEDVGDAAPRFEIGGESFGKFMVKHFMRGEDDPRNLYSVIADHYRLAAENQLMDADDGAILWWGYAANMVRSDGTRGDWKPGDLRVGPSRAKEDAENYTVGDLRYAISQARIAAAVS